MSVQSLESRGRKKIGYTIDAGVASQSHQDLSLGAKALNGDH